MASLDRGGAIEESLQRPGPVQESSIGNGSTERDALLGGAHPEPDHDASKLSIESPWRKPSVFWLLVPFFFFSLTFGGIFVPKLNLMLELVCRKYYADTDAPTTQPLLLVGGSDDALCKVPAIQRRVATLMLVLNFITGGLSAIVAPKLGHLSDGYGRLRLLALASLGGLLGEIVTVLVATFPHAIDYRWLVVGAVLDGLGGSFTAGSILSQSYTSDCSPPEHRSVSIGYIQACLFSGLAFGPLLAGYFAKWTGSLLSVFYVVVVCHAVFILFVALVVPESVSRHKQRLLRQQWRKEKLQAAALDSPAPWFAAAKRHWNPLAPLAVLWPRGSHVSSKLRINLVALAVCDATILGANFAAGAVIMLYAEYTFGWGNLETSRFVSAMSMMRVVILMGIFPVLSRAAKATMMLDADTAATTTTTATSTLDANTAAAAAAAAAATSTLDTDTAETTTATTATTTTTTTTTTTAGTHMHPGANRLDTWLLRLSLVCEVAGSLGYVLAPSSGAFFASGLLTAFGALGSATTQAVLTKHVPPDCVGQVLGAVGMLHALARVIGPVVFGALYAATVAFFPQAAFVALCGIYAVTFVISFLVRPGAP